MDKRELHIYMGQAINLAYNSSPHKDNKAIIKEESLEIFDMIVELHKALEENLK